MPRHLTSRLLHLIRHELRLTLLSGAGKAAIVLCCAVGIAVGAGGGMTPSFVGYKVARLGAVMLGFVCLPLVAAAARRDTTTQAVEIVHTRPYREHELLIARWASNVAAAIVLLVILGVAAFGAQALFAGAPPQGAGPRVSLRAFVDAMLGGAVPLIVLSTLGYCATRLLRNVLAVAIVGLYWVLVLVGRDYLSRVFDFSLSQNAPVYLVLSIGLVVATMAVVRYRQKLRDARRLGMPAAAAALIAIGLGLAWHYVLVRHDPPFHHHPTTMMVASQSIRSGRLPGFWLPDQYGRLTRLHDYEGKILVVGFWSPAAADSVPALAAWERINRKYAPQDVQVVGVCIADDWAIAGRFARERGYHFPMVVDTGTHWADQLAASSPLAEAYELTGLPMTFIADRTRHVMQVSVGSGDMQFQMIDSHLSQILAGSASGNVAAGAKGGSDGGGRPNGRDRGTIAARRRSSADADRPYAPARSQYCRADDPLIPPVASGGLRVGRTIGQLTSGGGTSTTEPEPRDNGGAAGSPPIDLSAHTDACCRLGQI